MDKLKPCPFCGGKAIITVLQHKFSDLYFCSCQKCHISQTSGEYTFRQESINAWNRRVNDASVRHGCWIGEGDGYADGKLVYDVWNCSECDYCIDDGTDDPECLPKYCPGCGAKMDGGNDNG